MMLSDSINLLLIIPVVFIFFSVSLRRPHLSIMSSLFGILFLAIYLVLQSQELMFVAFFATSLLFLSILSYFSMACINLEKEYEQYYSNATTSIIGIVTAGAIFGLILLAISKIGYDKHLRVANLSGDNFELLSLFLSFMYAVVFSSSLLFIMYKERNIKWK